jgi:hypothetical protein
MMVETSAPEEHQNGSRLSGIVLALSLLGALIALPQMQQVSHEAAPEAQISIQPEQAPPVLHRWYAG